MQKGAHRREATPELPACDGRALEPAREDPGVARGVGGGIITLLIGLDMLRGQAVNVDRSEDADDEHAFGRAKACIRDVVVPVAIPILAGPGSIMVQTRIWGLPPTAIAVQWIVVGLGESFPARLEPGSPIVNDVRRSADMRDKADDAR